MPGEHTPHDWRSFDTTSLGSPQRASPAPVLGTYEITAFVPATALAMASVAYSSRTGEPSLGCGAGDTANAVALRLPLARLTLLSSSAKAINTLPFAMPRLGK